MHNKNSLLLGQGILMIVIIVAFGLIIINEKSIGLLENKAEKAINEYLESNYQEQITNLNQEKITHKDNVFTKKITSKENKNLYFYVKYTKKELTDTYTEDFEEGKSLLTYLNKKLEKEIKKKTKLSCTVKPTTKLNDYSETVRERIIKEEDLLELKYFYIEKEFKIKDWNASSVTNEIKTFMKEIKDHNITPKYYEITITNQEDITTSIIISNITEEFIESNESEQMIDDILNNKELTYSKITVRYQN